jgi:glycosyltransferase involved in cell wall biosynthesis
MVNWVYFPEFSGAAAQCRTLIKELTLQGIDVEVLTGTNLPEKNGTDVVDGIKVRRVFCDKSSRGGSSKYALDMFSYIYKNRAKYDVIHSHGFIAQANLAARVTALPFVVKITNLNVDDPFAVSRRNMGRALLGLYRKASAVVATSPLLYDISNKMLIKGVRVEHIPNGVDLNRFSPAIGKQRAVLRQQLGIDQDDMVLLFIGTICFSKGLDLLLKAMKQLVALDSPKVRLLVVGPDEYMRSFDDPDPKVTQYAHHIRQEIETSNLRDIVKSEGQRNNVENYYKVADIFVHPSRREGQPNAIIEAMASGLPVVANCIEGITTEMIEHGHTGYVVNCEDSQLLAQTLKFLVDNKDLRRQLGDNARKSAIAAHDIRTVGERYMNLYHDIVCPRFERSHSVSGNRKIAPPLGT